MTTPRLSDRRAADRRMGEATVEARALAVRVTGLMREAHTYLRAHPDGTRVVLTILKTAYDDARKADAELVRLTGPEGSAA